MRVSRKTVSSYENEDIEMDIRLMKQTIMMKTMMQIQASITEIMIHE